MRRFGVCLIRKETEPAGCISMTEISFLATPIGKIGVAAEEEFITKVFFKIADLPEQWQRGDQNSLLREAQAQMDAYFAGKLREFDLPLYAEMSDFSKAVLEATLEIPYGQVITYGEMARRLGNPNAARAVGSALNRNPFPILIPCHRVVGSSGALTGYAGGLESKKFLLDMEKQFVQKDTERLL